MKLVYLIDPGKVFPRLAAKNLREAIEVLVPLIQKDSPAKSQKRLVEEVLDRERLSSTALGRGVALPHVRSSEVTELVVGIGTFPDGLSDTTRDNKPLKVVFLIIEPKRVSKLYLKTLGVLAKLVRIKGVVEKIAGAMTAKDIIKIIEGTDLAITEKLGAGDISRYVEPVKCGMTLKEVADLFFIYDTLTLPVLDDDNKVKGIVRCSDLLLAAMPEYARMLGDLRFLSEFEPFDRFLQEEDKRTADSIVSKNFVQAEEDASIVEITSLLLNHKENTVIITKEGVYTGIVSVRDIITNVMRP